MENLTITPKTKIFDLLEAYPQLEELLITLAPPFKKLKNPVLRKTITKITTLNQAAVIADIKVDVLINNLRSEVGQSVIDSAEQSGNNYITEMPDWFNEASIAESIDIREMLDAGEQPVHEVLALLKKLDAGKILKVIAPFIPAPLIDKTLSLNYKHWLHEEGKDQFLIFFIRA